MRRLALASVLLLACAARPAGAVVDDAWLTRAPDNRVVVDVDVRAASSTGSDIGPHCVAVHFFNPGTDLTFTYAAAGYWGVIDHPYQCFPGGLEDGDTRRVHLVSSSPAIPKLAVARVQVLVGDHIDTKDMVTP